MEPQINTDSHLLDEVEIGLGTWAWGDRVVWGYGDKYAQSDIKDTFHEAVNNGIRLFDTAEVYGQGKSERFLGEFIPQVNSRIITATKIMPFPWRLKNDALRKALQGSLNRLCLNKVDLYQIHWPLPPVSIENWMKQMADVLNEGLISMIGVSNFSIEQTKRAFDSLQKFGIPLSSTQVEYNLLERRIEKNGLMDFCKENKIRIIAYSPLAMGILSGKYSPENPPSGARGSQYDKGFLEKIKPLIKLVKKIGNDHDGKSASQVALNWVICRGALPIPGAKNPDQALQNSGAIGWRLNEDEMNQLNEMSEKIG